jgi:hypothetical protein
MQHGEGWFAEYHGADIGYSFLTVDLLAHVWKTTRDRELERALEKLLAFLVYFVHPDGTVGGEYGSRATTHCFPYGLELLAAAGEEKAQWMIGKIRQALEHDRLLSPLTVDDTYAAYFYLNSFCQAGCYGCVCPSPGRLRLGRNRFFPAAGLLVRENARYYAVVSIRKAGVWQAHDHADRLFGDAGYVAVTAGGKRLSSQLTGEDSSWHVHGADEEVCTVEIEAGFGVVDTRLPLVKHVIAFKLFTRWVLRSSWLAHFFSCWLKSRKILAARPAGIRLRRCLEFSSRGIVVEDTLTLVASTVVQSLYRCKAGTVVHSPSSQMFGHAALRHETQEPLDIEAAGQRLTQGGQLSLRTVLNF